MCRPVITIMIFLQDWWARIISHSRASCWDREIFWYFSISSIPESTRLHSFMLSFRSWKENLLNIAMAVTLLQNCPPFPEPSSREAERELRHNWSHLAYNTFSAPVLHGELQRGWDLFSEQEMCSLGPEHHFSKLVPKLVSSVYIWSSCCSAGYHAALVP